MKAIICIVVFIVLVVWSIGCGHDLNNNWSSIKLDTGMNDVTLMVTVAFGYMITYFTIIVFGVVVAQKLEA